MSKRKRRARREQREDRRERRELEVQHMLSGLDRIACSLEARVDERDALLDATERRETYLTAAAITGQWADRWQGYAADEPLRTLRERFLELAHQHDNDEAA